MNKKTIVFVMVALLVGICVPMPGNNPGFIPIVSAGGDCPTTEAELEADLTDVNDVYTNNDFADNSANWNTAFGWGDHSTQNYFDFDVHGLFNVFNQDLNTSNFIQFLSMLLQNVDNTFLSITSTNANTDSRLDLVNDAQNWSIRINGASSDRLQIYDSTAGKYPINIDASATQNNQIYLNSNGFTDFAGAGPSYRIELPNTANAGGRGRANAWPVYSDKRFKEDFSKLPKEETLLLCRLINWRIYKPIDNWQDENNTIFKGEVLNDFSIGAYAQPLYWDIVNAFGNNTRAYKIASQIVYVPDDENTDYWGVDFDLIMKIYARGWQILDDDIAYLYEYLELPRD